MSSIFYQVSVVRGVFEGEAEAKRKVGSDIEPAGQHSDYHTRPPARENIGIRRTSGANDQFR